MRAVHRRFEEFRENQERRDSFAAESSKGAQAVGERVQSAQAMAEDAGRAVASVRVAFEEYPADKPPVLNTIRRSFESFDNYLEGSGTGLGLFLDTVDVVAGDLMSLGDDLQEGMAAFRKREPQTNRSLSQVVAIGNFTEGGQRKFLDKYGETVGAVVGQLADSGLFGGGQGIHDICVFLCC